MDTKNTRHWAAAKISCGGFFLSLLFFGAFLFRRIGFFRASLVHPESGFALAQALLALAMGACLVMTLWFFASVKIHIHNPMTRRVLVAISIVGGVASFLFIAISYWNTYSYYMQWLAVL